MNICSVNFVGATLVAAQITHRMEILMKKETNKIILASTSPRRIELMQIITQNYIAMASDVDEENINETNPKKLALLLAKQKCLAVAKNHINNIVIGCDTVVSCNGEVFGKPKNKDDARRMLKAMSDNFHMVYTGVFIKKGGLEQSFTSGTKVIFCKMNDDEIENYISTDEPYDKAGGYGIQGKAAVYIKGIEGCFYNVMGFPISEINKNLNNFYEI